MCSQRVDHLGAAASGGTIAYPALMPWIEVEEPHVKPPRIRPIRPTNRGADSFAIDRGWGELDSVEIDRGTDLDLPRCSELSIADSVVTGLSFAPEDTLTVDCHRSELRDCDLSRVTVRSLRNSLVVGCKLSGTDFSQAGLADVVFERCSFRYVNLRMAKLNRVRFEGCKLEEVDGFELEAVDVEFPGTELLAVNLDRLQATRVDLREAADISFNGVGKLSGCLVSEEQLPALAYTLAFAADLSVEKHSTD